MNFGVSSDYNIDNSAVFNKNKQNKPAFKGWVDGVVNAVQTNKIVEATVVDAVSMVIPRTTIDYTRNPDAGKETARRELSGMFINCVAPGFAAMGIGWLLGKFFIDPQTKINTATPVNTDTAEVFKHAWDSNKNKANPVHEFVQHIFDHTEGLVGEKYESFKKSSKITGKNEPKTLAKRIADLKELKDAELSGEISAIQQSVVKKLGAAETLKIKLPGNNTHLETTAERLVENLHTFGKIFSESKDINRDVAKLIRTSHIKTGITVALMAGFAFSSQFINRYMTKKKTGSAAFVGLSDEAKAENDPEKQNKNSKFKLYVGKAASITTLLSIAAASIAGSLEPAKILETLKPKNLIRKLEYNSKWPSAKQLMFVYAANLTGRMLAASDKHELRETDIRDIPGFLNWLVLGGFVSKGIAHLVSNKHPLTKGNLLNGAKVPEEYKKLDIVNRFRKTLWHLVSKTSLPSHAEIDARKGLDDATKAALKKHLNISVTAGLVYATTMLGILVPVLNKHITKKITEKKKHTENINNANNAINNSNSNNVENNDNNKDDNKKVSFANSINTVNSEVFADFITTKKTA